MDWLDWIKLIVAVITGIGTAIPLVYKLITTVKAWTKEKNWNQIVSAALGLMKVAEKEFTDGASRKEFVMAMIMESAAAINYDLDEEALAKLSALIDAICDASKVINTPTAEEAESEE